LGVHFSGENPNVGGGVVDECGNFDVRGHGILIFLAFKGDLLASFSDGGGPTTPQTIRFDNPLNHVEAKILDRNEF
jgi:hypothetical protein